LCLNKFISKYYVTVHVTGPDGGRGMELRKKIS
jgi:hypothetical protein